MENVSGINEVLYSGNVSEQLKIEALTEYKKYVADKSNLVNRIRNNEKYWRELYENNTDELKKVMKCNTSFIFSAIENACAISSENFPVANLIEREPGGEETANVLSKLINTEMDASGFKAKYKSATRNKLKYGTAVYGVFYNDKTGTVDIEEINILDIFVDMNLSDIQDSRFLFISAAVDNDVLKSEYPQYAGLFSGDETVESSNGSFTLSNRSNVLDCYYKKPNGSVHMMKLCKDTILVATEDLPGYENGLYKHGLYPVVFDVMYATANCPFGFGMIDIGKISQIQIDKMDEAITENLIKNSKMRFFVKRNNGVDERAFKDMSKDIVQYEGEPGFHSIQGQMINTYHLQYREFKKDELKELLSNRDFQQGDVNGGVNSGTAIQLLQQSGEKRARSMMDDSYEAYKQIVYMTVELIREFYNKPRVFRTTDKDGNKTFMEFSSDLLFKQDEHFDPLGNGYEWKPLYFDVDIVPQKENPFTREAQNSTLLSLWNSGLFNPQLLDISMLVLQGLDFDGKEQLIAALQNLKNGQPEQVQQPQQVQPPQQLQQQQMIEELPVDAYQSLNASSGELPPEMIGGEYDYEI